MSPSPSNQRWGRKRRRKREIHLFFNHLCYAIVWGWHQDYYYVRNLFFNLIMKKL